MSSITFGIVDDSITVTSSIMILQVIVIGLQKIKRKIKV